MNITNIFYLKTLNKNIPHILITNKKAMTALYCFVHFKYSPVDSSDKVNSDTDLVDKIENVVICR